MDYFTQALKNYAVFEGRTSRKAYWMFFLFYFIFLVVLGLVDLLLGTVIIQIIYSMALLIPSISIAARRLHDTGRSGWWQLIALIPLIGTIVLIVFLAGQSDDNNQYGDQPESL